MRLKTALLALFLTSCAEGGALEGDAATLAADARLAADASPPDATCQAVTAVTWQDPVGVSISNQNVLTKTGTNALWDAGAHSKQVIPAAGYVEAVATEHGTARMFGLSNGNTDSGYVDIDFAVFLANDDPASEWCVQLYEQGVMVGHFGTYQPGDVFRVEAQGSVVTYSKNGEVFYTSLATPTYPLLVDATLNTPGATLAGVVVAGSEETCPL